MKKFYLIIFALLSLHIVKATNEVPNSSFTTWASGSPTGWSTDNASPFVTITDPGAGYTDAHAAKGQSVAYVGDTLPPILLSTGNSNNGFTISQNYSHFQFYYKTNLVSGNQFIASVTIEDGSHSDIGAGAVVITSNVSGFTLADVTIYYSNNNAAASAVISFLMASSTGSSAAPSPSSYFIVDDVSLSGLVGVEELTAESKVIVSPVPAHDFLTIKGPVSTNNKPMQIMLRDIAGRLVLERKYVANMDFIDTDLSLQGLVPGFYSLIMMTDEKEMVRRIVVQ